MSGAGERPQDLPVAGDDGGDGEGGDYRFGYVALVGRPNVGKSTLLNRILGQKISIVTAKPQTTRQRVAGIRTTDRGQVVYVDTPGLHRAAGKALNRYMNRIAKASLRDVDLVLFLIEAGRWTEQDGYVARAVAAAGVPVILVLNKVDLVADKASLLAFLDRDVDTGPFERVMMVSARRGDGVEDIENEVLRRLPFSRPFYDEDQITDRSERFLAAELIREQLMQRLHKELPYALTVEIETFERDGKLVRIAAIVWVERESQKQIVIGKGGRVLKQVGSGARAELETLLDQQVYLNLWVKVARDWSSSERLMERFGYGEDG